MFAASLQNFEKLKTSDTGKAVAMDGNLFLSMNDVDIVPGRKRARYLGM